MRFTQSHSRFTLCSMPRPCLDPRIFIVLVIAASSPSSPWVLNVHWGLGPRLDSLNNSIFLQDPRSYNYFISMLLPCTMTVMLWFFICACFSKYVHLVCSNRQASCQYLVHAGPMVETELCFHEHWSHALSFSGLQKPAAPKLSHHNLHRQTAMTPQ